MNTNSLIFAILFATIFIAFDILIIIITIQAHDQLETSKYQNLADIGQNWRRGPIKAFSSKCISPNIQSVDAEWAGTVVGCLSNGNVSRNRCPRDKNGTSYGRDIFALPPVKMTIWKDIILCTESMGSYFDLNLVSKNEDCPPGTKKCGRIDSLDNILCVNSSDDCPVTKIIFSNKEELGYTAVKGANTYLNYSKEPTEESIPIQLKMSERNICADLSETDSNRTLYILEEHYNKDKCQTEIATSVTNPFFKVLDVSTVQNVFHENGIFNYLLTLPDFPLDTLDTPMHLSTRSFIGINMTCRERVKEIENIEEKFMNLKDNLEWIDNFTYTIKSLAIVFGALDMFFLLISAVGGFEVSFFLYVTFLIGFLIVGFQITLLSMNLVARSNIGDVDFDFAFIGYDGCSDAITNESILLFQETIQSSADLFGWLWIINLVYVLLYPATLILAAFLLKKD